MDRLMLDGDASSLSTEASGLQFVCAPYEAPMLMWEIATRTRAERGLEGRADTAATFLRGLRAVGSA
jgi:hypothetical protein